MGRVMNGFSFVRAVKLHGDNYLYFLPDPLSSEVWNSARKDYNIMRDKENDKNKIGFARAVTESGDNWFLNDVIPGITYPSLIGANNNDYFLMRNIERKKKNEVESIVHANQKITDSKIMEIAEDHGLGTLCSDGSFIWFDSDCKDFARALITATVEAMLNK